jgi:hypothetical protein
MSSTAIPTSYKGYLFRSRLEARWGVFFDALRLEWEYEPEGFQKNGFMYLPDFRVRYPGRCEDEAHYVWFEVKPNLKDITTSEIDKMLACMPGVMLLDGVPDRRMYNSAAELFDESIAQTVQQRSERFSGAFGAALFSSKGRLWWDDASNFFDDRDHEYPGSSGYEISLAVNAARSARFEHGQKGAR